jgi:hypothetical protein
MRLQFTIRSISGAMPSALEPGRPGLPRALGLAGRLAGRILCNDWADLLCCDRGSRQGLSLLTGGDRVMLNCWKTLALFASLTAGFLGTARAVTSDTTLVLPLRSIGVSDTTVAVMLELLTGELEARSMPLASLSGQISPTGGSSGASNSLSQGALACADPECALDQARRAQADRVLFGSLSRLGDKVIVQLRGLRVADGSSFYNDRLTADREEDLDAIARRMAESIASGAPNSQDATVETVTEGETKIPLRRATRSGVGVRAGILTPGGNSYGGADRLTTARVSFRSEGTRYYLETTTLLGCTWGVRNFEWSIVDLNGGRIFGLGDLAAYLGGGLGVHYVRVGQDMPVTYGAPGSSYFYTYNETKYQSATTFSLDAGGGVIALRTYSMEVVLDLRYHHVLSDFSKINGKGAHGLILTIGTSR